MEATFIPGVEINSQLGIVNAARVSLNAKSEKLDAKDKQLIKYLFTHKHWTPFAHARLYFHINWSKDEALTFYKNANLAGFSWVEIVNASLYTDDIIKGSLYSWINNLQYLPKKVTEQVGDIIYDRYPVVSDLIGIEAPSFCYETNTQEWLEGYLKLQALDNKELYKVLTATLRVKVPLFVARQMRTSQVGFAYSDLYVEHEAFVFNEVSRRYVNSEPEFYAIKEWRVREGKAIKQGSTGKAKNSDIIYYLNIMQETIQSEARGVYRASVAESIAPEQARALLPQSMYTEFYMTGTLHRWAQFLALRLTPDVQQETREFADLVKSTLSKNFPDWRDVYNLM